MTTATKKVLLIDDDPVIAAVYQKHLQDAGFEVRLACDGQAGLSAVSEFRPDVVLLDLSMPNLNGIQWLKEIRGDARFAQLPVVVCTAGTIDWQMRAATKSDVTYILYKEMTVPRQVVETGASALKMGNW